MNPALLLRTARRRAGLSLRTLARRAATSHSTLAAYESGRATPTLATLERILGACGFTLTARLGRSVAPDAERAAELVAALDLAAQFPARHETDPRLPIFATR